MALTKRTDQRMQRLIGYLFLAALLAAGVISLVHRLRVGTQLDPFGNKPDWLGIALITSAFVCAATHGRNANAALQLQRLCQELGRSAHGSVRQRTEA